jgi:hypothetical protein
MKRVAAWLLTKIVRRLLGKRPPGRPGCRPRAGVWLLMDWQLESRELPGDTAGGLFLAALGLFPNRDAVAGAASLFDGSRPFAEHSSPRGSSPHRAHSLTAASWREDVRLWQDVRSAQAHSGSRAAAYHRASQW